MSFSSLLNSTADIQRQQQDQGVTGAVTKDWKTKHADIPARLQANKTSSGARNDKTGEWIVTPFTIYINVKYDICKSDRIYIEDICYEIIRAEKDSSRHHWQLQCKLTEN